MKDQNCWCGTGRLCQDPELKYTPSGIAVCSLRLACNKGREENGQTADFFTVEVWRGAAEFASTYLHKGSQVAIQGRVRVRSWQDGEGNKRTSVEIVANELNSLGKTLSAEHEPQETAPPAASAPADEYADFNDPFADQ